MGSVESLGVGGARPGPAGAGPLGPGDRFGPWQIEAVLGQGAHGVVCAARDRDGAAVTLKLPRDLEAGKAGETDALLRREAEVLAQMRHPNVAAARGLDRVEGRDVLLLEPIEGESLAARLDRDRAGEPDAAFDDAALSALLRAAAAGLEAVHEAGYLHGDVKPANIFIRPDGCPLLVDFGTAEPRDGATRGEIGHATAGYAAIEQYQSDGLEGPWTDLYGLAAVAYRIVGGRPPPPAPSRAAGEALLSAARAGKSRYAPALLEAIDAGLALDPTRRPQSLADWLARLDGPAPAIEPLAIEPLAAEAPPPDPMPAPVPDAPSAESAQPPAAAPPTPAAPPAAVRQASPLPTAPTAVARPLDDLPPTEKVTRLPLTLRAGGDASFAGPGATTLRAATLRAERRERERTPPPHRSRLGFLAAAVVIAVLGYGGWEGYLRFVKSEWLVDPAGAGDTTSVAAALRRARDGARVHLAPGRYAETIVLSGAVELIGPDDPDTPAVIEPPEGPCLIAAAPGAAVSRLVLVRPAAAQVPGAAVAGAAAGAASDGGSCVVIDRSLRVEDSTVSSGAGPAVLIRAGADPALTRVSVGESAGPGVIVEGGAGGTITDSTIRNSAKAGILVRDAGHPTVTGSRIEGAGEAGLLVATGGAGYFEDNEIVGSAASAVELREGADPELRGNLLSGSAQAGLFVYAGGKGRLNGNRIVDNAFSGVVIADDGAPVVTGNEIVGNGEHGVAVLERGGGKIADNRIADNKGHGIVRADGSPAEIGDNVLAGNQAPQLQVGRRSGG